MKQTIEIEVPEGKKAVWNDNKVVFEDIKQELPKTWEEYCNLYPKKNAEFYIGPASGIIKVTFHGYRFYLGDRNLLSTEKDAKAHLALMQLHRLRDYYRQGWIPKDEWYAITAYTVTTDTTQISMLVIIRDILYPRFLSFQSREIAEKFLNNFRDLIEEAGDLI